MVEYGINSVQHILTFDPELAVCVLSAVTLQQFHTIVICWLGYRCHQILSVALV